MMKKNSFCLIVVLLAAVLCLIHVCTVADTEAATKGETTTGVIAAASEGGNVIASGECGASAEDHVLWTLTGEDDDLTLTISGSGSMENFYMPRSVPWKNYKSEIKTVIIEDGPTSIGDYAFYQYSNISSITIASSVREIGKEVFDGCRSLTSITIPAGVSRIRESAFDGCTVLEEISLPDTVTIIESKAFYACTALHEFSLPKGLTQIGDEAFRSCRGLSDLVIPKSVTSIGESAFYGCSSMTSFTIPDGVTDIKPGTFRDCSKLVSVVLPDGVTSIGESAFSGCSSLTDIAIPDGVTSIGGAAFNRCSSITSLTVPDGITAINSYTFEYCDNLSHIDLPDGLTYIGESAFCGCKLTSIEIPDGVTEIPYAAFIYCYELTDIVLPEGLTSIDESAFAFCKGLAHIIIPDSVTSIGLGAFRGCSSLIEIEIPDWVTSIGRNAFYDCESLKILRFYGNQPAIGEGTFTGVTATAYYPATWTSVPSSTEYGGNITWVQWDPEAEIISGGETVRDGYELKSVSNDREGILVSLNSILEQPETCPDGFYLMKKEEGGKYTKLKKYRFDPLTPYAFGWTDYLDTDVDYGKTYSYALRAFKGTSVGKYGPALTIRRVLQTDIDEVYGYDLNRFPIYRTAVSDSPVLIHLAKDPLPAYYLSGDRFNGSINLIYGGKAVLTSSPDMVTYMENYADDGKNHILWKIPKDELLRANLPADTFCTLRVCDSMGETIAETTIRTSFERLSFCNSTDENILEYCPGAILSENQHISENLAIDFLGRSKGKWLNKRSKNGLGQNGLCFGMAVATDQFQAGLLSAKDAASKDKLDLILQGDVLTLPAGHQETLLDLVKRQHLYQFLIPFLIELENNNFDFDGLLKQIDNYTSGKSSLMPLIWLEAYEGDFVGDYHTLLAYAYQRDQENDRVTIHVYEPGDPYKFVDNTRATITIDHYSTAPEWVYSKLPYPGNVKDAAEHKTRFSWTIPDWDIYSDSYRDDSIMADISEEAFEKDLATIRKKYPDLEIRSMSCSGLSGNPLLLIRGEGTFDLSGICSSISLATNDCTYEITDAESIILDLGTQGSDSENSEYGIRSVTVGGDANTTITYSPSTETETTTYTRTLDDSTSTLTVENSGMSDEPFKVNITPEIVLSEAEFTYNGREQKPEVTVKDGDTVFTPNDYEITWPEDSIDAGTYDITVTMKGDYAGSSTASYTIAKAGNTLIAHNIHRSYAAKAQVISLKAKATGGELTYRCDNARVKVTDDGKVKIAAKFAGTAKIKISAGGKNYGTVTKTITVSIPTATKLSSVKINSAGKMTIKWKKNPSATGYQIQYSPRKNFSSKKTVTVKKNTKVSRTISNLKKGRKYYVRIRSIVTTSGKTYYSAWSVKKN